MTGCSFLRFFFFCPILKCSHNSLCESYFYYPPFRDENTKAQELLGCLLAYEGYWPRNQMIWAWGLGLWSWLAHGHTSHVWTGVESQTLAAGKGVQHVYIQAATPASPGEETPFPLTSDPHRSGWPTQMHDAPALPMPQPAQRGKQPEAP